MRVAIRQGIVAAPTTMSAPNFLQNSGGNVNVVITNVPVVFTFAHGQANYLASEQKSVTNAWGPFAGPTVNYLYWELDELTGRVVRGSTTLAPTSGPAAPPSPVNGQMWFNSNNTTMYVWKDRTWKATIRVMAGQATGNTATVEPIGSQVGLAGSFRAGYILRDGSDKPIRVTADPNTGAQFKFLTTETELVSAGNDGSVVKLESSAMFARAGEPIGAFSLVYAYADPSGENTALLVGLASSEFTVFEEKAAIGIVDSALATNDVGNLITSGIVYNDGWNWLETEIGKPLYCGTAGEVTLTKPNFAKVRCVGYVLSAKEIVLNVGWETDFDGVGPMGASGYSGVAGASGFSGYSGATGTGTSGYSGATGAPGASGFSGYSGIDGAVGASGFSGYSGIDGAVGASGFSGYSGIDGSGSPGASGYSGIDGASGFSGYSGINGAQGTSGYSGIDGASGFSGYSGTAAAVSEPSNQVVFGTGSGVASEATFTYDPANGALTVSGATVAGTGPAGDILIEAGIPTDGRGGDVLLYASNGVGTDRHGGSVELLAGSKTGTGQPGNIKFSWQDATGALLLGASAGGVGQALTSNGAGANPSWQTVPGVTRGTATLSSGTATVNTAAVTNASMIFVTVQSLGTVTAPKAIAVTARVANTSFTITSEDVTDTSVVAWMFMEP